MQEKKTSTGTPKKQTRAKSAAAKQPKMPRRKSMTANEALLEAWRHDYEMRTTRTKKTA